jgi:opacity protein-like surface antigen
MKRVAIAGSLALSLLVAREARAFERQQHAGLDAGGAMMTTGGTTKLGIDLGLHYTYGLSDAFNVVGELSWMAFPTSGATGPQPSRVIPFGAGLVYVFDVLRWVPYAGALVGGAYANGGFVHPAFVTPDVQLAAGLDYALSREWTVGAAYRQHMWLAKTGDYPNLASFAIRAEYVWGW